ncbi:MAG: hypothetical protein JWO60_2477, partial [Frankiales bacterium]|nr:hypothetical protein [Frankiales bacterium]
MTDGRLTYTSVDARGAGSGGWQVMEESDLTDEERRRALEVVATAIDPAVEVSRFPSLTEIDALPRRLVVTRAGTSTLLVHSAPAGPDASGRPGNVFNHVVAARDLTADLLAGPDVPRPVQLWRSDDWLHPWGADQVRASRLPGDTRPAPGRVVTRAAVAGLLADPASAAGLGALLDAVDAAVRGDGDPVVLLVDEQDRGALWLGAVSLLAGPSLTARLTFSTWERGYALRAGAETAHVSLVPRADEAQLHGVAAVVLDPDSQAPAAGGAWPTVFPPRSVPVGTWSRLATGLCGLPEGEADNRLLAVAELSSLNPRVARVLRYALFPLAVAVVENDLPGADVAAGLLAAVPEELVDDAETAEELRRALAAFPLTAEAQATALTELVEQDWEDGAPPVDGRTRAWLEQVLREPALVHGPWPAPLPAVRGLVSAAGRSSLAEVLGAALTQLLRVPLSRSETAVALLRVVDLAELLDVGTQTPPDVVEAAAALAVDLLLDPNAGPDALERAGQLTDETRHLLLPALAETVERCDAPHGERLPPHLRRWAQEALAEVVAPETPLFLELLLVDPSHPAYFRRRAAAARELLRTLEPSGDPGGATTAALVRTSNGAPWNADELAYLHDAVGGLPGVDLRSVVRDVLAAAEPGSPEAQALAEQVLTGVYGVVPVGTALAYLAELHRALAVGPAGGDDAHLVDLLVGGVGLLLADPGAAGAAELAPPALAAGLLLRAREGVRFLDLDNGRRHRLGTHERQLPLLLPHLPAAVPLLVDALARDEGDADLLFEAVARAAHPAAGGRLPRPDDPWLLPLDPAVHGRARLGEAVLHGYAAAREDAGAWLDRTALGLRGYDEREQRAVREWARSLRGPALA